MDTRRSCAPGRAGPRSVRDSAPSDDPEVAWLGAGGNRLLETRLRLRCRRTSIQGGHNPGTSPRRNLQNDLRPSVWDCASAPRHVTAYDAHIWCWFAAAGYPELNFKPTVSMSDRRACRLGEFLDKRVTVPCANVNADSGSMSSGVSAWRTQPAIRSCLRESTEGQNCFPILSTWSKSTSSRPTKRERPSLMTRDKEIATTPVASASRPSFVSRSRRSCEPAPRKFERIA